MMSSLLFTFIGNTPSDLCLVKPSTKLLLHKISHIVLDIFPFSVTAWIALLEMFDLSFSWYLTPWCGKVMPKSAFLFFCPGFPTCNVCKMKYDMNYPLRHRDFHTCWSKLASYRSIYTIFIFHWPTSRIISKLQNQNHILIFSCLLLADRNVCSPINVTQASTIHQIVFLWMGANRFMSATEPVQFDVTIA